MLGEKALVQSGLVSLAVMLALSFALTYLSGFPVRVPVAFTPLLVLASFGIAGVYVIILPLLAYLAKSSSSPEGGSSIHDPIF